MDDDANTSSRKGQALVVDTATRTLRHARSLKKTDTSTMNNSQGTVGGGAVTSKDDAQTGADLDKYRTFPRFKDFPPEIQAKIWEKCLPRRLVNAWYLPMSLEMPNTFPTIAHVCRHARNVAFLHGQWTSTKRYAKPSGLGLDDEGSTFRTMKCWLDRRTDLFYLDSDQTTTQWMCDMPIDGSDGNDMIRLATQDHNVPLLISTSIRLTDLYNPRVPELPFLPDEARVAQFLYEGFLQPRSHCFLELWRFQIHLRPATMRLANRAGLMGMFGDQQTAVINVNDTEALKRYAVFSKRIWWRPERQDHLQELIDIGFKRGTIAHKTAFLFWKHLMRLVVARLGASSVDLSRLDAVTDGMVDPDGNLVKNHPLVAYLGLSQPSWTPVVVFHLRTFHGVRRVIEDESLEAEDDAQAMLMGEATQHTMGDGPDETWPDV